MEAQIESTTAHTPGPWVIDFNTSAIFPNLICGRTEFVARVKNESDAKLVAAAPDLLKSATEFLLWFKTFIGDKAYAEINCAELTELKTAIFKAIV